MQSLQSERSVEIIRLTSKGLPEAGLCSLSASQRSVDLSKANEHRGIVRPSCCEILHDLQGSLRCAARQLDVRDLQVAPGIRRTRTARATADKEHHQAGRGETRDNAHLEPKYVSFQQ